MCEEIDEETTNELMSEWVPDENMPRQFTQPSTAIQNTDTNSTCNYCHTNTLSTNVTTPKIDMLNGTINGNITININYNHNH
jgi:hypothetical protein